MSKFRVLEYRCGVFRHPYYQVIGPGPFLGLAKSDRLGRQPIAAPTEGPKKEGPHFSKWRRRDSARLAVLVLVLGVLWNLFRRIFFGTKAECCASSGVKELIPHLSAYLNYPAGKTFKCVEYDYTYRWSFEPDAN